MKPAILILLLCLSGVCQALSVQQAYDAIPHARTTYDVTQANNAAANTKYLHQLFTIVDQLVVARVEGLQGTIVKGRYAQLIDQLAKLTPPKADKPAQQLIIKAVTTHEAYFKHYAKKASRQQLFQLQKASSRQLIRAYQLLMQNHAQETTHNKKSFFDHLCALDFL